MHILTEIFRALLMVGLPICLFTLLMVWWALHRKHFRETSNFNSLEREIKAMSKSKKNNNENEIKTNPGHSSYDLIHKKWMKFGGGFYGIVALFTWLVIEATDIAQMVINFGGFIKFLQNINIGLFIHVFIEALINFIVAIIWPVYWLKQIDTNQAWLWFIAAYFGYWLGIKLAQELNHWLNKL